MEKYIINFLNKHGYFRSMLDKEFFDTMVQKLKKCGDSILLKEGDYLYINKNGRLTAKEPANNWE